MNRTALYAAAALLLLFAACELLGPEPGAEGGPDGKAAVRIAITASGTQGRTALPAVALEDATAWELWGGEPSSETQTCITALSGTSSATVYLETGDWDFTVKGYNGAGAVILQGTLPEQTISLEEPDTLTFTVAPHRGGNGTYQITIKLPPGHGITTAKVFSRDEVKIDEFPPKDNRVVFKKEYPAGDYYFSVRLYNKDDKLYGVVSETAQVRANLLSESAEYALTAENLNIMYSINYDLGGGGFASAVENPGYYRSVDIDFELPQPTRDGYDFEGWHVGAVGGEKLADIPQGSKGDKDFYAKWTPVDYPISYQPEGIDYGENPATYTIEDEVTLQDPPLRDDFRFGGWHNDSQFKSPISGAAIPVGETGPKTFYAKWKPLALIDAIKLQPVPDDPELDNVTVSEGETPMFTAAGDYSGYQWYWDSELKSEESSYTLPGNLPTGIYELAVVVSGAGNKQLATRCTVIVKAKAEEGGGE
jgi:uncharacterized repeat protein (TIGR02543 family)